MKAKAVVMASLFGTALASLATSLLPSSAHAAWQETPGLYAVFSTSHGTIVCQLFEKETPITVTNFTGLADGSKEWLDPRSLKMVRKRFYDGLIFHRVIPNFMIQAGCPLGNGTGGPGFRFGDEIVPSLKFDRPYLLAMANAGPGTNGSQFFITQAPTPWLDGRHTIFGQVVEGQNVVDAIAKVPRGQYDKPVKDVVIQSVDIKRVENKKAALYGKKVLFVVAPRDFKDVEYAEPKKILTDEGAQVVTASLTVGDLYGVDGARVQSDILLADAKIDEYAAVVFIGGPGANIFWSNKAAHKLAKETMKSEKVLGAICLAPVTLANAGVLKHKNATAFPSVEKEMAAGKAMFSQKPVERDGNLITAAGPEAAKDFGFELLKALK